MAEAEERGQQLDTAIENLSNLLGLVSSSLDRINEVSSEFESMPQNLNGAGGSLIAGLSGLWETSQDKLQTCNSVASEAMAMLSQLPESVEQLDERVDSMRQSVEEATSELTSQVESALAGLEGKYSDAATKIAEAVGAVQGAYEQLSASKEATSAVITEVQSSVGELKERLEGLQEEVEGAFGEFREEVAGAIASRLESGFGDFSENLTETRLGEISEAFSGADSNMQDLFQAFDGTIQELGTEFMQRTEQIIESAKDHLSETLKEELEEAFQEAAQEVIEAIIQEIVATIVLMTTGTAVTGALSPVLPELVVAQKAIELVNDVLSALDVFG